MSEPHTIGPVLRHAFAPHPEPIEQHLHRIHVVFEEADGRLWSAGTATSTLASAEQFADRLNESLGLDRDAWAAFARSAFDPAPDPQSHDPGR